MGRVLGLFERDQAGVDLLLQQRMVASDLRKTAFAQPVAARVADVTDHGPRAQKHTHDQRGAHAGVLRVGIGGVEDGAVGVVDADFHRPAQFAHAGFMSAFGHPASQLGLDEGGGHGAGDFACVVATHAIGQHSDLVLGIERHRIFVVVSNQPRVGQAKILKIHSVQVIPAERCCLFRNRASSRGAP